VLGERVELNCSVRPDIYPPASVVWWKQKGNSQTRLHVGEKYTIQRAAMEDSGTYTCTATNNPGKSFGSRSKKVILHVYLPASCSFISASYVSSNISVTVKLSGMPQPLFQAALSWYQRTSTVGRAVATTSSRLILRNSSKQLLGHLTQVIIARQRNKSLSSECRVHIDWPAEPFQLCLFIRFTPNNGFCRNFSSFNRQAKLLRDQLLSDMSDMSLNHNGCQYEVDIHAVFVESDSRCQPFRISFTIKNDINSSSDHNCPNASKLSSWLYHWHCQYGTVKVKMLKSVDQDRQLSLLLCKEGLRKENNSQCHQVFYCNKPSSRRDRIVCMQDDVFRRRLTTYDQNLELSYFSRNSRQLCLVSFENE
jgi:hypothetical protein